MRPDPPAAYRERPSPLVPGAVVWSRTVVPSDDLPVLPDGCMDLLWTGERLLVAGPDTRGNPTTGPAGATISGIRFAPGAAPALLGVPAHELRDRRVDLADVWSPQRARALAAIVRRAADPLTGLESAARRRATTDPMVDAVVRGLRAGKPVAATADSVGLGARRLHRLSLSAFGYGPKTLARILRLQRALEMARRGTSFAETAYAAGYADQAHLTREVRALAGVPLSRLVASEPDRSGGADQSSGA